MNTIRSATPGLLGTHHGLLRKLSWVALSGFMRQLAFFIVNVFLAYRLSKESFGTLTWAFGSLLVFVGVADFGLREIAWREIARNASRTPEVVSNVLATRLIMTLVAMIGFIGSAVIYCRGPADWLVFLIYSFGLFFNMSSFDYPFLGRDKMGTIGKSAAIAYAYYVPACLLTVWNDSTAWLVALHFVVAHAIFVGLLYRDYRQSFGPIRLSLRLDVVRDYFRRCWLLGINGLVFRLTINYPVLLLGLLLSSAAVAEYRIAEMFYSLFASLGVHLGSSMFTTYAASEGQSNGRIARSVEAALRTIFLVHLPIAILFVVLLPVTLHRFANLGSSSERLTCLLLGIGLPFGVATRYLKTCLPSVGLNVQLLTVNTASLVLGVGAGIGLAHAIGVAGVAASVLISEACGLCLLLVFLKRKLPALRLTTTFRAPAAVVAVLLIAYFVVTTLSASPWLHALALLTICATWTVGMLVFRPTSAAIASPD